MILCSVAFHVDKVWCAVAFHVDMISCAVAFHVDMIFIGFGAAVWWTKLSCVSGGL